MFKGLHRNNKTSYHYYQPFLWIDFCRMLHENYMVVNIYTNHPLHVSSMYLPSSHQVP